MRVELRIPETDHGGLAWLFRLDGEKRRALVESLKHVPPSLSPKAISADVAARAGIDAEQAQEVLRVLRAMYFARRQSGATVEEFTEAVVTAAGQTGKAELRLTDDRRDAFKAELAEILKLDDGFGVWARALELMNEQERLYCSARILTDVRSVFRDDVTKTPPAAVILHTLRIEHHPGGRGDEYERTLVALDAADLRSLRRLIDRALEKEATLCRTLDAAGIRWLVHDADDRGGDAS